MGEHFGGPRERSLKNALLHTFGNAPLVNCSLKRAFCQEIILQGCAGEHFWRANRGQPFVTTVSAQLKILDKINPIWLEDSKRH